MATTTPTPTPTRVVAVEPMFWHDRDQYRAAVRVTHEISDGRGTSRVVTFRPAGSHRTMRRARAAARVVARESMRREP